MSSLDYNFEFVTAIREDDDIKVLKEETKTENEFDEENKLDNEFEETKTDNQNKNDVNIINFLDMTKCGDIIVVKNKNFFLTCICNKKFKSLPDFSDHYLKYHITRECQDNVEILIQSNSLELYVPGIEEGLKDETQFDDIYHENNFVYRNVKEFIDIKMEIKSNDTSDDLNILAKNSTNIKKPPNKKIKLNISKIKNIVCEICGKNLPNKSTMIRHQRTHTGERPFKCRHCQKGFNYKNHCQRHEQLHIKEKIYECDFCYLKFSQTDNKKVHEASHTIEDKEKVAKLGKKLASLTNIETNKSESLTKIENLKPLDDSVPDGYWRCKVCEKILKNSYKPEDHHRLHTGEKPFICDICGKGMFSQSNLLRHVATHTQNRRYRCTKCPAAFYCSTHLKRHEISHNSEKQFKCDMCDMKFWRKEHLTAHQVRHLSNRQRNHKCDICEKSYLDVNALRHHKKKHINSNDTFMCGTCPAVFQLKEALKRHEKRHINKGMYRCDFCPDKRFNDKDDKNQHEKRCHLNLLTH